MVISNKHESTRPTERVIIGRNVSIEEKTNNKGPSCG